jgi:DNA modification methylase
LEILTVKIDSIKPYENNAKEHPKEQIEQIKKSIQDYGNNDPIAVDENNVIIEGHGRYIAMRELGFETVEIIRLEHLTEEQKKAYRLVHNKLTMNSDFNVEMLEAELAGLQIQDMQEFGFDFLPDFTEDTTDEDIIDEVLQDETEATVKNGDIWLLGEHRLICGDCTDAEVVEKLFGESKADLLLTDPPYNVAIENSAGMTIENDNMSDTAFYSFLQSAFSSANSVMREGTPFYIWHGESEGLNFRKACKSVEWELKQSIIWVKSQITLGRQDYQWKHEPCLYGWKSGGSHYFIKNRKQSTVIDDDIDLDLLTKDELREMLLDILEPSTIVRENKPQKNGEHPTMKPVSLIKKQVKNSTKKGEIVLDIFGGSGTTLLACEELDRICYMCEIDPKYCDVIIKRWETLTGETAVLLN